jgi:hypothetical protein
MMAGAMATIDDGAWTAIKHTSAIFDEDRQTWPPTLLRCAAASRPVGGRV